MCYFGQFNHEKFAGLLPPLWQTGPLEGRVLSAYSALLVVGQAIWPVDVHVDRGSEGCLL